MCDPLTIAGIALSGAGMAANMAAQGRVDRARRDTMAAERIRQQGYDREAQALNTQSQNRYEGFEGQQENRAQSLADFYSGQNQPADAPMGEAPQSSSNITVREEAKRRAEAAEFGQEQAEALGNFRAFGDLLGGIGRLQARDAQQIGQLGNFKQGSSNVLGFELEDANQAGGGLSTLGTILGGLGKIGTTAGLSGGLNLGGGAASGAAASAPSLSMPLPKASLTLPTPFSSVPSFANPNNMYRLF